MTLPDKLVAAATEVLIYHAATSTSACLCGGVPLGASIAEHQARLVLEAVFAALPECDEVIARLREGIDTAIYAQNFDLPSKAAHEALYVLARMAET